MAFGKTEAQMKEMQSAQTTETIAAADNKETETAAAAQTTETQQSSTSESNPATSWLDAMNKEFNLQFKTVDEAKTRFERANKADEYEPKIIEFEQREKDYKQRLEEAQRSLNPLEYFSSQDAYIAEQMKKKFPDLSSSVLQELATRDTSKMDNVELVIKGLMLSDKELSFEDARDYVMEEYKLEDVDPSSWSNASKTRLRLKANEVKSEISKLREGIKLPEIQTPEQIQAARDKAKDERKISLAPQAQEFAKLDKLVMKVDDETNFEMPIPESDRIGFADQFEGYFLDGEIEYNPENLKDAEDIRNAMYMYRNFAKIYKAIETDVVTKQSKATDKLLGNEKPLNQSTNTSTQQKLPGLKEAFGRS
mgnify:FL=1